MENVAPTQASYSVKEKYFSVMPETRIRRYQFFVRSLVPGILVVLFYVFGLSALIKVGLGVFGINGFLAMMYMGTIAAISMSLIFLLIGYFISLPLSIKRCHDFNSDGKWSTLIIKTSIGYQALYFIILCISLFGITIPGSELLYTFGQIIGVVSFILWIILLFRPGTKGDNQYGPDSANNKIGFFG